MNKRVAVVTDNDGDQSRILSASKFNMENQNQHVFIPHDVNQLTWEFCIYDENKVVLDKMFSPASNAKYVFRGVEHPNTLGYMLCHKADVAYKMAISDKDFTVPDYVKDAIAWVLE